MLLYQLLLFKLTCRGLSGGIEAAIYTMRRIFNDPATEGIVLVDAKNEFNAMNIQAALHNIYYTCPELATFVIFIATKLNFSLQTLWRRYYQKRAQRKGGQSQWRSMRPV